ncbi:hypothetical protein I79_007149 [Cricetulus griseus]|uniref:Uncharacterized protein n=1 Tax=Cricetulus griseus TaxID=10029 RepID=G3H9R9_CRIGR|nr:hypothetical protein I79_007149 [Cricetulus griseus]
MNKGMNEIIQVSVIPKVITKSRNGLIIQQISFLGTLSGSKLGDTIKERPLFPLSEGDRKEFTFNGDCNL